MPQQQQNVQLPEQSHIRQSGDVRPNDIPRRIERMALSDCFIGLMQIYIAGLKKMGVDPIHLRTIAGLYRAAWRGRKATVSSLSHDFGLPRETVRRHLNELVRQRTIIKSGQYYYVSADFLLHPPGDIDGAIKVLYDAVAVLRRERKNNTQK